MASAVVALVVLAGALAATAQEPTPALPNVDPGPSTSPPTPATTSPAVRVHMDLGDGDNSIDSTPKRPATHIAAPPTTSDANPEMDMPDHSPCYERERGGDCMDVSPLHAFNNQLWFRGDYLMWWTKAASLPPLVTTGIQENQAGAIGAQGTSILFGNDEVSAGMHSGGRFTVGSWIDPCEQTGVEASYFFLGTSAATFNADQQNYAILARPFFNTDLGVQDAFLVAYPGDRTGNTSIRDANSMYGFEVALRRAMIQTPSVKLDFIIGYRYANFSEDLSIDSNSTFINPAGAFPVGTTLNFDDQFSTINEFNGGELGISAKTRSNRWSVELLAKVALGDTKSRVSINGSNTLTEVGVPTTTPGGFFAQPTNSGSYNQNFLTFIPELGATVEYQLSSHIKATAGYSFMYWNKVARAGDQIDTNVNTSQLLGGALSGAATPHFSFVTTDFWAQGVNFGIDIEY